MRYLIKKPILLTVVFVLIFVFSFISANEANAVTLNRSISSGPDDGFQSSETLGIFWSNRGDGYGLTGEDDVSSYHYNGWFRFTSITVPKGATINSATLTFKTRTNTFGSGIANTVIYGVDEDNHTAPVNTATWQTDHGMHTSANVAWNFSVIDADNSTLSSPNIASIIQEIVDRSGWSSGNAIGIHWDEVMSNIDRAQGWTEYENTSYDPPLLSITYTLPQCSDGADNDGDGATDYSADFSCSDLADNDETNPKAQCQDGVDNDGDGLTDLSDPGCSSKQDNSENSATSQCQDGADNDGDGATDWPNDFSCSDLADNDETNPKAQCQDGVDNSDPEDTLVDLADPGCANQQDNDETDGLTSLSGSLISSTFDTSVPGGVKIATIMWNGLLNGAPNYVRFQIASSNCEGGENNPPLCSTGGWGASASGDGAYIGSGGTDASYYTPVGPGTNYSLPVNHHNNKRYFRYKIYLYKDLSFSSPVVNDVIINWVP